MKCTLLCPGFHAFPVLACKRTGLPLWTGPKWATLILSPGTGMLRPRTFPGAQSKEMQFDVAPLFGWMCSLLCKNCQKNDSNNYRICFFFSNFVYSLFDVIVAIHQNALVGNAIFVLVIFGRIQHVFAVAARQLNGNARFTFFAHQQIVTVTTWIRSNPGRCQCRHRCDHQNNPKTIHFIVRI